METLVAVHRNHNGDIISFTTSAGRIISYQKALVETEDGIIQGVQTAIDTDGRTILNPDAGNSFDEYPNLF